MCEYLIYGRCCGECDNPPIKNCPDCNGKLMICDECGAQECVHLIKSYDDYDYKYERFLCVECAKKLRDKLEQQQKEIMAKAQKEVDSLARDIDHINQTIRGIKR